ncbi:hypothetical protein PENSPDRAFT_672459 [Peniophora sp. CONT]|nr:hypothetical protein PENSPDRAFT_672459 [Peniophora sp. CONT]
MSSRIAAERQPSESPSIRPAAVILEWNFMASRINAVLAMIRAHKQFNITVNLQKVADGMTIERAQGALISGRLAIQGMRLGGEIHQNHDLAFRHGVDHGQRALRRMLELNMNLPRWGSNSDTPPPPFESLRFFAHTNEEDWIDFCGASGVGSHGMMWWTQIHPVDVNTNAACKSLDAARVWLRLAVRDAITKALDTAEADLREGEQTQAHRAIYRQLQRGIKFRTGTGTRDCAGLEMSVKETAAVLEHSMEELEISLRAEFANESLADSKTLYRRLYQWWLKANGGVVGDRAELAHILAVRLQSAKSELGRILRGKRSKTVVRRDAIWIYLRAMMVELRDLDDVPAEIAAGVQLWIQKADKAANAREANAIRKFITGPIKDIAPPGEVDIGPCRWWVAYARGLDLTLENIFSCNEEDGLAGESDTDVPGAKVTSHSLSANTTLMHDERFKGSTGGSPVDDDIRLPWSVLESTHPPDEINQYKLNWLHPTNFWADWSKDMMKRSDL